jgi:hypothetical protein
MRHRTGNLDVVALGVGVLAIVIALSILAALLFGTGCAESPVVRSRAIVAGEQFWTDARCYALLRERDRWMTASKFFIASGGTSSLGAALAETVDDEKARKRTQISMGIGGGIGSAVGITALWRGETINAEFERFCEVGEGGGAPVSGELAPMPAEFAAPDGGTP